MGLFDKNNSISKEQHEAALEGMRTAHSASIEDMQVQHTAAMEDLQAQLTASNADLVTANSRVTALEAENTELKEHAPAPAGDAGARDGSGEAGYEMEKWNRDLLAVFN